MSPFKYIIWGTLALGLVCSPMLMATEVVAVRLGKTKEKTRLVIDSNAQLDYQLLWQQGQFWLRLDNLTRELNSQALSPQVLAAGVRLIPAGQNQPGLIIPIQQTQLVKHFQLPKSDNAQFRTIVDWLPKPQLAASQTIPIASQSNVKSTSSAPSITKQRASTMNAGQLLAAAQQALIENNNRLAISYLTKLLNIGDQTQRMYAIEFLGVAREREGQLAFAKQYYQQYLREFPETENAARVQLRLNALIGIQNLGKTTPLKKSARASSERRKGSTRGSLAADYRISELVDDNGDSRRTASLLSLDLDVRGNYQLENNNLWFQFSGGRYEDLLESDRSNDRLRYANLGWENSEATYRVDIGRQRSSGKGIFGRFDGILAGYNFNDRNRINLVFGYPVASSKVLELDPERQFYGISYDVEDLAKGLNVSFFAINQDINSLTDRQAVGAEFNYSLASGALYGLIDYDFFYSELNAFLLSGNHTNKQKTRIYWSINQRKSPYISTRNALIGQSADSLEELQDLFLSDEEILDLATDRTTENTSASFQISRPINTTYEVSGNITWNRLEGTPASGGVPEIQDSGDQYYLNLYLSGNKLYSKTDYNQFGFRYSDLSNSSVWSLYANTQYRISSKWRIDGKLRYDDRSNDNGTGQQNIAPTFRMLYQDKVNYFYADLGAILYTNQVIGISDLSTDIYFAYIGYRRYF